MVLHKVVGASQSRASTDEAPIRRLYVPGDRSEILATFRNVLTCDDRRGKARISSQDDPSVNVTWGAFPFLANRLASPDNYEPRP